MFRRRRITLPLGGAFLIIVARIGTVGALLSGDDPKEDEEAREAKMAAVKKVISMLGDMNQQVLDEGEEEAKAYNKFACFCKDTTEDKTAAIEEGEDAKESLIANIEKLEVKRKELNEKMAKLEEEIEEVEKEIREAKEIRAKEKEEYDRNEADLSGAISAIAAAMQVIKASKPASLAQMKETSKTVQDAALLADALGLELTAKEQKDISFLQDVPSEDYKFHSDSVIEMLEKLQKDFRAKKVEVDKAEAKAVAEFDMLMQEKTDELKRKNRELDDTKKEKEETQSEIAQNSEDLSVVAATLLDDQEYLMELSKMCGDKAKTWDARSKIRADELSALTAAIDILEGKVSEKTSGATVRFAQQAMRVKLAVTVAHSEDAMERLEAATESDEAGGPIGFLQRSPGKRSTMKGKTDGRQAVINLLRSKGALLRSAALASLATAIADDPFAKVKQLIQELIERLLKEASAENEQKGWCDKSIGQAKQKRRYAAEDIDELNSALAENEAIRDKLIEELDILDKEIKELKKKQAEAEDMRKKEKSENEKTIEEASAGLEAVQEAITLLDRFYKTAAKNKVDLSLTQGPADDAPDTGFDAGEAYTGAQGGAKGVIGMLEVIKSDFKRTMAETKKAEAEAEQDHLVFMTETGKSLAEKDIAVKEKTKQLDNTEQTISDDKDSLKSKVEVVTGAIKELLELKEACETGMSYEERVARREDEIKALKQALCVLDNYQQYGPDGGGDC